MQVTPDNAFNENLAARSNNKRITTDDDKNDNKSQIAKQH